MKSEMQNPSRDSVCWYIGRDRWWPRLWLASEEKKGWLRKKVRERESFVCYVLGGGGGVLMLFRPFSRLPLSCRFVLFFFFETSVLPLFFYFFSTEKVALVKKDKGV